MSTNTSLIPNSRKRSALERFGLDALLGGVRIDRNMTMALSILAAVALVYVGVLGIGFFLERSINTMNAQKQEVLETLPATDELAEFAPRAQAIQEVIATRPIFSTFADHFAAATHPNVQITHFALAQENTAYLVEIEGRAGSFETVGQQFVLWRDGTDFVSQAQLGEFTRTADGAVQFSATLTLNNQYAFFE
ncbi:MAG: hypothetical protein WD850_01630 [Candidatus Spechtbacterales bacterium]